jgi:hypothetical protein
MYLKDQGSISPRFYETLLHGQIPKVQKKMEGLIVFFFAILQYECVMAECKILVKSTPDENILVLLLDHVLMHFHHK